MKDKNIKFPQSPFGKYFHKHLQNVQISLREFNENILSRKKNPQNINKVIVQNKVEISSWQNSIDQKQFAQKQNGFKPIQENKGQMIKLLFLSLMWVIGIYVVLRSKQDVRISMNNLEWEKLVEQQFSKNYTQIYIQNQYLNGEQKLNFGEYCDIINIQWMKDIKPYFSFAIEDNLNSILKMKETSLIEFSVFDKKSVFINFEVYDIKLKADRISFNIRISYIQYNFSVLKNLSSLYLQEDLIDKDDNNHFYLQKKKNIMKLFQNAIHDFI